MTRKFTGGRLVVATHNKGKVEEIGVLLAPYVGSFASAGELGLPEPEENGGSFIANAIIKAQAAARGSGEPALADDSGLCVAALGGDPGVDSALWGGAGRDFAKAMALVHERMGDAADRSAHFICVLALAWPDGHVETVEGRCNGAIVWPPRGAGGHGYDPVFLPEGAVKTFGEMTMAEKQAFSHRARAFSALVERVFLASCA